MTTEDIARLNTCFWRLLGIENAVMHATSQHDRRALKNAVFEVRLMLAEVLETGGAPAEGAVEPEASPPGECTHPALEQAEVECIHELTILECMLCGAATRGCEGHR